MESSAAAVLSDHQIAFVVFGNSINTVVRSPVLTDSDLYWLIQQIFHLESFLFSTFLRSSWLLFVLQSWWLIFLFWSQYLVKYCTKIKSEWLFSCIYSRPPLKSTHLYIEKGPFLCSLLNWSFLNGNGFWFAYKYLQSKHKHDPMCWAAAAVAVRSSCLIWGKDSCFL